MAAELIYVTTDEVAVKWFTDAIARRDRAAKLIGEFHERVNAIYGGIGGVPRDLRFVFGLAVGMQASSPFEEPPHGWKFDGAVGGFTPDTDTPAGVAWQEDFDELPPVMEELALAEIGMIPWVNINTNGVDVARFTPSLHMGIEGDIMFAIWGDRTIKPALDAGIEEMGHGVWTEMPRSEWFARVERFEAEALAEQEGN